MDIVRMALALIVMLGHLIHIKGSKSGFLIDSHFEKVLSSGPFAVLVFFGLSGIALRFQTDKHGLNYRWFLARITRLMPVYWVTLIPPIVVCMLLGVELDYPNWVFLLDSLGLQAALQQFVIPPINGPLWSLSVEIYLSASLLFLGKRSKRASLILLVSLILVAFLNSENTLISAFPIFFFGYLLPNLKLKEVVPNFIGNILILIPASIFLFFPSILQRDNSNFWNLGCSYLIAAFLLINCHIFSKNSKTLVAEMSLRSYSLYAVHAPIILFIDQLLFAKQQFLGPLQFIVSIFCIFISTEILYRLIERPTIALSRNFLIENR